MSGQPSPSGLAGLLLLACTAAGVLGTIWTGDWRYAASGAVVALVVPAVVAVTEAIRARGRDQGGRDGQGTPAATAKDC